MTGNVHIPQGTQDYLPLEYAYKAKVESTFLQQFTEWGYQPVETPVLEYLDVFTGAQNGFEEQSMFKLTDQEGRLLALRPDLTIPLARLCCTKLRELEQVRLCYVGNAYQFAAQRERAGLREYTQAGVELLGPDCPAADSEVVALAIEALQQTGLQGFQIEIGQAEFFKGLMEDAGLPQEEIDAAAMDVESKNTLALEIRLQQAGVDETLKNRILELPLLYGGREVLARAREYSANPRCIRAIDNLEQVMDQLARYGVNQSVSVDLGMVPSLHYYTGIIFRGMVEDMGYPLLTGGRYNNLLRRFGKDMPATGFAVYIKPLLIALERQGVLRAERQGNVIIGVEGEVSDLVIAAIRAMRMSGMQVEQFHGTREEMTAYAAATNARSAMWYDAQGRSYHVYGKEER